MKRAMKMSRWALRKLFFSLADSCQFLSDFFQSQFYRFANYGNMLRERSVSGDRRVSPDEALKEYYSQKSGHHMSTIVTLVKKKDETSKVS